MLSGTKKDIYDDKMSIRKKDQTIINMYVPNKWDPKYTEQKMTEIKGKIKNLTTTVENSISHFQ